MNVRALTASFLVFLLPLTIAQESSASAPDGVPQQTSASHPTASAGITLTAGTQLVVVDVTVLDRDGHPIHGLKASDFMVDESKKAQVIRNFDEHASASPVPAALAPLPHLPPSTFTDYEVVPPESTLNVLLLDALNTPQTDQSYVRYQLQQYVKHAVPGTRIAIFGLSQKLTLLQGFSSDPEILKAVVEHKLLPRASVLLDDPAGTGVNPTKMSDTASDAGAPASVIASMQQFEAQSASFQTQLRTTYTIAAFEDIGRYLAQFPGRKNLIWFSGSFPLTIFADPDIDNPFAVQADASDDLREASNLLSRARVAVFPVDARGLQTNPVFSAANSGSKYARDPTAAGKDISKFNQVNAEEHMTMNQIADDTGGHAFYNTNDLASAVAKAITAGSNYYTITYSPSERKSNGEYRSIKVQLQGEASARAVKLSYRHGYYAANTGKRPLGSPAPITAATAPPAQAPLPSSSAPAFRTSSMERGAPTLSEILFKVRVLRAAGVEEALAPDNRPNPKAPVKGPFRRYLVDFAALGSDFKLETGPDGHRHGNVEFLTYVYDGNGNLLNSAGVAMQMNLGPETYTRLARSGVGFHQEVSVPAKGESFLRIGVHDISSGRVGVVEVPTSSVSAAPPPPPAATATTPAAAVPVAPAAPK